MERNKERQNNAKQDILHRVRVLYSIFILVGIGIAARLLWVQLISPDVKHNAKIMETGVYRKDSVEAHRGAILSRSGEPLAMSSFRYYPLFDFAAEGIKDAQQENLTKNVDALCDMLAEYFSEEDAAKEGYTHLTAKQYREMFYDYIREGKARGAAIFPRKVTLDEWRMMKKRFPILNFSLGYVYSEKSNDDRIYPHDDLAYQIIGRSGEHYEADGRLIKTPAFGIEHLYNNRLAGKQGFVVEQRIAHGFWARVDDKDNLMPIDGCNVVTTIDAGLQKMATERLDRELMAEHGSFGVAMVMEVETGNILCLVNLSTGVERGVEYSERHYNHALSTAMTPGSTMKLASAMALLEIGGYTIDTKVNTEHASSKRSVRVGAANIYDSHDAGETTGGEVTLKDGFAHSSNVYFAKAIYERFKDEPEKYTSYLEKLLFNDFVGLQHYGETKARLPLADSPAWNKRGSTSSRLPRLAYGYEIELPPIHTLTFYNGVANNGRMVAPRLIDRIEHEGKVVERMPVVTLIDKMCSESTIKALHECMGAAAAPDRTLGKLRGLPVTVGCKTGTAQIWGDFVTKSRIDIECKADGLNEKDKYYMGSMVATFPLEKPKYTVMVCITKQSTPTHPTYFGISLTGSIIHDIIEYVYNNDPTLHAHIDKAEVAHSPTHIKGGSSDDVTLVARELASSTTADEQLSDWGVATVDNEGNVSVKSREVKEGYVPNVVGMGLSEAIYLIESAGLEVTHSGAGRVVRQSVVAGTAAEKSPRSIHLTLER